MKCVSLKGETSARDQLGSVGSFGSPILAAPPVPDLIPLPHRMVSDSEAAPESFKLWPWTAVTGFHKYFDMQLAGWLDGWLLAKTPSSN